MSLSEALTVLTPRWFTLTVPRGGEKKKGSGKEVWWGCFEVACRLSRDAAATCVWISWWAVPIGTVFRRRFQYGGDQIHAITTDDILNTYSSHEYRHPWPYAQQRVQQNEIATPNAPSSWSPFVLSPTVSKGLVTKSCVYDHCKAFHDISIHSQGEVWSAIQRRVSWFSLDRICCDSGRVSHVDKSNLIRQDSSLYLLDTWKRNLIFHKPSRVPRITTNPIFILVALVAFFFPSPSFSLSTTSILRVDDPSMFPSGRTQTGPHQWKLPITPEAQRGYMDVPQQAGAAQVPNTLLWRGRAVDEWREKEGRRKQQSTRVCVGYKETMWGYVAWCSIGVGGSDGGGKGGERWCRAGPLYFRGSES